MMHTHSLFGDPPGDPGRSPDTTSQSAPSLSTATGARDTTNGKPHGPRTRAPARRNGPSTSREAARRIAGHVPAQEAVVLAHFRAQGDHGATDREVQAATGLCSDSEVPRRWALVKDGVLVDSGRRRLTPARRRAIVWTLAEYGPQGGQGVTP